MNTYYVGIDPGIKGAVGILDRKGQYAAVHDIPIMKIGEKNKVDAEKLMFILVDVPTVDQRIMVERVHAMPNQGVTSVFSFGETYGRICAAVECGGVACTVDYVVPRVWKKYFQLDNDKNKSLELARSLFPNAELHLKKHSDRAEALLIARYLYEKD